jgi:hypothetical protein
MRKVVDAMFECRHPRVGLSQRLLRGDQRTRCWCYSRCRVVAAFCRGNWTGRLRGLACQTSLFTSLSQLFKFVLTVIELTKIEVFDLDKKGQIHVEWIVPEILPSLHSSSS